MRTHLPMKIGTKGGGRRPSPESPRTFDARREQAYYEEHGAPGTLAFYRLIVQIARVGEWMARAGSRRPGS